jgi:hypothetical protein
LPGELGRIEEGLPVGGVAGSALGLAERDQQLHTLPVGLPFCGEQAERLAVISGSLVVGELGERAVAGARRIGDGLVRLSGGGGRPGPVVGQGREVVIESGGVDCLDALGDPAVQRHPAHGGEAVVEGVPHEGVGKAVPAAGRLDDEPRSGRLLQSGDQLFPVEASRGPDQLRFELRSDHRRRAEHPVGLL